MDGYCWDVRLDFVRQFKTELVRLVESLIFEKKIVSIQPNT
jgi:hypothetical protein